MRESGQVPLASQHPPGSPGNGVVTPGVATLCPRGRLPSLKSQCPSPPPPGALGNTAEMCSREGSSSLYAQWRGRWPVPSQATDGQTDGRQTEAQSEAGGQAVRGRRCEPQR